MKSTSQPKYFITNDRDSRERKASALAKLFAVTPHGGDAKANMHTYLEAAAPFTAALFESACDLIAASWIDTYRSPAPGNICATCKRLQEVTRVEQRRLLAQARIDNARRDKMTITKALDEIERLGALPFGVDPYPHEVDDDPYEDFCERVRLRAIDALDRYVARAEGRDVAPRPRHRIDGLQPIGTILDGEAKG